MNKINLYTKLTNQEIDLIKQAGINIENRDYTKDELARTQSQIVEYIMTASSKNGDIDRLRNQYDSIFRTIHVK